MIVTMNLINTYEKIELAPPPQKSTSKMSACSVCGEAHHTHRCNELHNEIKELKDPQPTGPRGHDDEDDALNLNTANHSVQNAQAPLCAGSPVQRNRVV